MVGKTAVLKFVDDPRQTTVLLNQLQRRRDQRVRQLLCNCTEHAAQKTIKQSHCFLREYGFHAANVGAYLSAGAIIRKGRRDPMIRLRSVPDASAARGHRYPDATYALSATVGNTQSASRGSPSQQSPFAGVAP